MKSNIIMDTYNRNIIEKFEIDSKISSSVCCVDTWTQVCLVLIVVSIVYVLINKGRTM